MALVDANYSFTYVNVGCQGRISDGGVFKNTDLWKNLVNKSLNLPQPKCLPGRDISIPYVIVADDHFFYLNCLHFDQHFRNDFQFQQNSVH